MCKCFCPNLLSEVLLNCVNIILSLIVKCIEFNSAQFFVVELCVNVFVPNCL